MEGRLSDIFAMLPRLASKLYQFSYVSLPNSGIMGMDYQVWYYYKILRIISGETQILLFPASWLKF